MKRHRERLYNTAFFFVLSFVLLIMFVVADTTFEHARQVNERHFWVLHTKEVLLKLKDINIALKDAETGQRGFLLTGRSSFLLPYAEGCAAARVLEDEVAQLVSDNPRQVVNDERLREAMDLKLSVLTRTVAIYKTGDKEGATALVLGPGKESMDHIRSILHDMNQEEERLFALRTNSLERDTKQLLNRLGILLGAALIIFILVAFLIRSLALRRAKELFMRELSYSASTAILNEASLQQSLHAIPKILAELLEYKVSALWQPAEAEQELQCTAFYSALPVPVFEAASRSISFAPGVGLPGRCWQSKEPAFIANVLSDANFPRAKQAQENGLHAAVAFPLLSGEHCLGVFEFFSDRIEKPDPQLMKAFEVIGREIGLLVERQQTQEKIQETYVALSESERKFKAIFDSTYEFIGLLTPEGILLDANRTALGFVNKELPDVVGQQFWETPWWSFSQELQQIVKEAVGRASKGEFVRFESSGPNWQGDVYHFDVSITPVVDRDGKVVLLIPEGRDITDKKTAEIRVSEFYSTVSHELRTPLTSIRGSLGLIEGGLAGEIPEKTKKLISIARTESDRLIRLINEILDLRKIEAGMLELRKSVVDSHRLIERTLEGIKGMSAERQVELVPRFNASGSIECDEDRIVQVLTNLLSNAIKFSDADGQVIVSLDKGRNGNLRFSVIDRGRGIAPKDIDKLFGKFQQINQSDSRPTEGTGLGLAITKAIVEQHKGHIGVESQLSRGSTFWFELAALDLSGADTNPGEFKKVVHAAIIVEDDDNLSFVLDEHLRRDGFGVVRAKTLVEARMLLKQYRPLVVILDLRLPDGNGLDLLEQMSADERLRNVPVVVVTGVDQEDKDKFAHPALIDWIKKPFDASRLHKALDLAKSKIGPAQVLIVEDDAATREVLKHQLEVLGVRCIEAKDGVEAVSRVRNDNPDLVLLDLAIPSPDGYSVVEILRREKNGRRPLIVYTASDLTEDQKASLKLGLTAFLTKGTSTTDELLSTVREYLNGLIMDRTPPDATPEGSNSSGQ